MTKTAKEWFEELPQHARDKAIANTERNSESRSLSSAIFKAFIWGKTSEGETYWEDIHNELLKQKS